MRLLPFGPGALLVEVADDAQVRGLYAHLLRARVAGQLYAVDVVPAARTVLVDGLRGPDDTAAARAAVVGWDGLSVPAASVPGDVVVVTVRYDGADLAEVARVAGLTVEEVVRRHADADYEVAFCGFQPGFAYLTGLPERLRLPRRAVPRTHVPAGSVAVAGEYAGVYPRAGPGGWHLLGRTGLVLFDPAREPAALLAPGMRVRFEAVPR
ncbi:MAG TPA: allophanate hydrolase subunit 1 [Dermatophilaceae bacterium]|nr:allophanate hydrolase subunit 1 [Dermatophilaceae bacterium]